MSTEGVCVDNGGNMLHSRVPQALQCNISTHNMRHRCASNYCQCSRTTRTQKCEAR